MTELLVRLDFAVYETAFFVAFCAAFQHGKGIKRMTANASPPENHAFLFVIMP